MKLLVFTLLMCFPFCAFSQNKLTERVIVDQVLTIYYDTAIPYIYQWAYDNSKKHPKGYDKLMEFTDSETQKGICREINYNVRKLLIGSKSLNKSEIDSVVNRMYKERVLFLSKNFFQEVDQKIQKI